MFLINQINPIWWLHEKLGARPSSGIMAIYMCLLYPVTEVGLFGFDWGKTPTFYTGVKSADVHDYAAEKALIESLDRVKIHK